MQRLKSTVSGLYFVGPASALSFGPLFRFVVGAEYTSQNRRRAFGMIPSVETRTFRIAVLSGAGGGVPDLRAFCATSSAMADFAPLVYPGWQRYAEEGFCARAT